jgi:hypothetical protein
LREALAAAPRHLSARGANADSRPKRASRAGGWARLFGLKRRPGAKIFLSVAALAAVGVPLNALYFQDGRHPAPLFRFAALEMGSAKDAAPSAQRAEPAAVAKTQTAKADAARADETADLIGRLLDGVAPAAKSAASKAGAAKASKTAGGTAPKSSARRGAAAKPVAAKPVAAKPVAAKSAAAKPVLAKSAAAKPVLAKSAVVKSEPARGAVKTAAAVRRAPPKAAAPQSAQQQADGAQAPAQ